MDVQMLTQYFLRYGAVFIFVIILLEYMNLQDSGGIIMPLAGIWAARGQISFFHGNDPWPGGRTLGSWFLYGIGRDGRGLVFGPLSETLSQIPEPVIQGNFNELLRTREQPDIDQQADSHDSSDIISTIPAWCHPNEFC